MTKRIAIAAACLALAGCGGSGTNADDEIAAGGAPVVTVEGGDSDSGFDGPELQLAQYAGDVSLAPQFAHALDEMEPKCTQDRDQIAAYAWATWVDLRNNGVDESLYSVLGHGSAAIPDSLGPTDCQGIFAAYAVLREKP